MDYLYKGLALNDEVKVYVVNSKDITNEAIRRHDLWPSPASVLGKAMTIAIMMGGSLKLEEALTIKIDGNGPVGVICCDCDSYGNVRGYVTNPHVNFTNKSGIDEVTTLGTSGYIDVIKDLKLDNLFTSSIEIITGDLAKDFTYYFMKSEQTPSAILLGSKFDCDNTCITCGGILIQLLPNATEKTISYLEDKLKTLESMSSILLKYNDLEDIYKLLFEDDYQILTKTEIKFNCPCSKERFKNGLLTLSKEELNKIYNDNADTEVVCHYCNEKYTFTKEDIQEIIKEKTND